MIFRNENRTWHASIDELTVQSRTVMARRSVIEEFAWVWSKRPLTMCNNGAVELSKRKTAREAPFAS
jgi:hypothetical protein